MRKVLLLMVGAALTLTSCETEPDDEFCNCWVEGDLHSPSGILEIQHHYDGPCSKFLKLDPRTRIGGQRNYGIDEITLQQLLDAKSDGSWAGRIYDECY